MQRVAKPLQQSDWSVANTVFMPRGPCRQLRVWRMRRADR